MIGSPGFSRWDARRGSSILPGPPAPAEYEMTGSPGFSRWDARRGSSILPGPPAPAEYEMIGSPGFSRWDARRDRASCRDRPLRRKPGLPASGCPDYYHGNVLSPVGCRKTA
ncbi:MAG: hypothetical protein ACLFVO_29385 [Chloroflexaceae bacterium]